MNIVITGSRSIKDQVWIYNILLRHFKADDTMINGACRTGVDAVCEEFVRSQKSNIDLELMPADWEAHGRGAGPIRNKAMVKKADICLAFWDGKSRGTKSTIDYALQAGIELHVYVLKNKTPNSAALLRSASI